MKGNHMLGHISKSTINWLRVVIISFYMALEEDTSRKPSTNEMLKNWRESSGEPQDGPGHGHRERLKERDLLSLVTRRCKGLVTAVSPISGGSCKHTMKENEKMGTTSNKGILSTYSEQMLLFGKVVQIWNRCPENLEQRAPGISSKWNLPMTLRFSIFCGRQQNLHMILNQFTLFGSRKDCIRKAMFCVDEFLLCRGERLLIL